MAECLLDFERQMPHEQICPRLARVPFDQASREMCEIFDEVFGPLDVRGHKVKMVIEYIRLIRRIEAAQVLVTLDEECLFLTHFAFDIYGMTLVSRKLPPAPF